jgi:uncharacterized membrane protein YgcG
MNKKRIISYVVLLMVLTALMSMFAGCATSEKNPTQTVKENVFIYDEDNIIDDDVEKTLNKMLVELEEKTEVEFSVVSVESVLGSIEDYANNLFNTFGIDKDNGVLLLFSQSDEKVILKIGRELKECLTDSECGQILDDYFVPYQEDDDYTKATEMTVKAVLTVIAEEYEVNIQGLETDISVEDDSDDSDDKDDKNKAASAYLYTVIIIILFIGILDSSRRRNS